jgi:sec-independent protein translocase protein TatB
VNDVKADISREMELDELRKLQSTVEDAARAIEQTVNKEISTTESELNNVAASVADTAPALPSSDSVPPSPAVETSPAPEGAPTAQLELGLDPAEHAARKQV